MKAPTASLCGMQLLSRWTTRSLTCQCTQKTSTTAHPPMQAPQAAAPTAPHTQPLPCALKTGAPKQVDKQQRKMAPKAAKTAKHLQTGKQSKITSFLNKISQVPDPEVQPRSNTLPEHPPTHPT